MFDQSEFNQFVVDQGVIGFFDQPIKLKSGRMSNWYVNWRTVAEDAYLLDRLTTFVIEFASQHQMEPTCFYGVAEGASKLGVLTQMKWAQKSPNYGPGSHVVAMGRGKAKEHGAAKDKFFLGVPQSPTVVLEDVTTTGGSLLNTLAQLAESEIEVVAALGLTNRMEVRDDGQSVLEAVKAKGVNYYSMSNALELLPLAAKKANASKEICQAVEQEFAEFGVEPLKFAE